MMTSMMKIEDTHKRDKLKERVVLDTQNKHLNQCTRRKAH